MRRTALASVLVAIVLACSAVAASAQAEDVIRSDAAQPSVGMSVEVPPGAAPPGTPIEIVSRPADERPADLDGLPIEAPFYELHPIDLRFEEPVRITRALDLTQFGLSEFDPAVVGYPVATLFSQDPDGAWSWLASSEVRFDPGGGPSFLVTGESDHGGPYFGYLGGSLIVVPDESVRADGGGVFRVEAQLHGPPGSEATLASVSGVTSDAATASVGEGYEVESFVNAAGIELACHAPGTVDYVLTFTIAGMGEDGLLQSLLGRDGATVEVIHVGGLTCPG